MNRGGPAVPALLAIGLTLLAVPPAKAQRGRVADPADPVLSRIDSLIAAAAPGEARRQLSEWKRTHPAGDSTVTNRMRAHALLLGGRLATTWREAEEAYMAIALGYPVTSQAPEALLRLGQGLLASPKPVEGVTRAAAYLERLISDYPNSPFRAEAWLWLARAHEVAGRESTACASLREAARLSADAMLASLIAADRARICGG